MGNRFGRPAKRSDVPLDRHRLRRIPILGALVSPIWLALALVVVTGAGVTAYAAASGTPIATGSSTATTSATAPLGTTSPTESNSATVPSGMAAHPGGATVGNAGFNAVSCESPSSCVAVGADAAGNAVAATSSNGGTSFVSQPLPAGTPRLASVSCVSGTTCVAVGGNDIIHSTNNGASWSGKLFSQNGLSLVGVGCESTTLCIAGGLQAPEASNPDDPDDQFTPNQAVIFTSEDGGSTWTQATIPENVAAVTAVACPTATTCIAVGSNVLVSTDGGQTWVIAPVKGGMGQLLSISCASATICVAVGPSGAGEFNPNAPGDAVETTDGGSTFQAVTLPSGSSSIFEVSCGSATSCIGAGATETGASAPVFISSTDGGSIWSNATPPPKFTAVSGLSCPALGPCVAVGSVPQGTSNMPTTASLGPSGQWTTTPTPVAPASTS